MAVGGHRDPTLSERLRHRCDPVPLAIATASRESDAGAAEAEGEAGAVEACLLDVRGATDMPAVPPPLSDLPLLLLVDPDTPLPDPWPEELAHAELVTPAELDTDLFAHRLRLAVERRRLVPADPVRRNAYDVLSAVMSQSNEWIVLKDLEHRFRLATGAFAEAFDRPVEQILGRDDLEIGTPERLVKGDAETDWRGFWYLDDEITAAGVPVRQESGVREQTVDGDRYERTDKIPLKGADGEVYALLVHVSQIYRPNEESARSERPGPRTSRPDMYDDSPLLKRLHDEKVSAEQRGQVSEHAVLAKNKFIAAASHDLRQPLHALGLFLSSLERRASSERDTHLIERMKQSVGAVNNLLNSLLDISRLDANVVEVQRSHFSLKPLLQELYAEHAQLAVQRGLELRADYPDVVVFTDPVLLGRILRNLVGNAVKYTRRGSVSIDSIVHDDVLQLCIRDTGPGIPEHQQDAIFDEFHQLDDPEHDRSKGLGLGLAIVDRLCRLLELDLTLQSVVGEGTRFTLSIPPGQAARVDPPSRREEVPLLQRRLIVIVDDDEAVRLAVQSAVQDHGCDTLVADSADGAIRLLSRTRREPSALLVDYRLGGGVTGDQAVGRIRQVLGKEVPAVIITGDTSGQSLRGLRQGGYRVLNKPVEPARLLHCIGELLGEPAVEPVPKS